MRVVRQRVDVIQGFGTRHAAQMRMLDHLERALEQFDPDPECLQTEIGRLNQDDEIGGYQRRECSKNIRRRHRIKIDEGRMRKAAPVGRCQRNGERAARIEHHHCRLRARVLDRHRQNIPQVPFGGINRFVRHQVE